MRTVRGRCVVFVVGLTLLCSGCTARQPETKPGRPEIVPLTLEQEWEIGAAAQTAR